MGINTYVWVVKRDIEIAFVVSVPLVDRGRRPPRFGRELCAESSEQANFVFSATAFCQPD
jgi:hypothetical protein